MDDTPVEVVALADGDKRMFFQENTGDIRESIYTSSSKEWVSNINNVVATDARNSTPIAAYLVSDNGVDLGFAGPIVSSPTG